MNSNLLSKRGHRPSLLNLFFRAFRRGGRSRKGQQRRQAAKLLLEQLENRITPAVDIAAFVNGQDADSAPGPHVAAGSTVTFTYVVTNTGGVPSANVVVSDDKLGPVTSFTGDANINGLLDLTETWTYTATATALAGQQTNTGTVTALDNGTTVSDSNPANYFGDVPAINIVKFVNGQDADSPAGPHVAAGSTVTFTYVVTNTGNVPLANVAVTDDKLGTIAGPASGDANNNGLLDLTETWIYTRTATALAGQQTNVGTVTGQDANNPPGTTVTDNNPGNYFGDAPGIHIVKFVNGQDADSPAGPHVAVGSTVTFTYVVTNTGNVPLANVAVTDDKLGSITSFTGDTNGNGLLDLTETWFYATTAIAVAGQQTNVGTVTAQDPNNPPGTMVTDGNPANYFGDAPAINIVKFVNGQDANTAPGAQVSAGSTLTFTYVVTNTGNVPLANVVVSDDKLGPITSLTGDTNGNGLLDLTETWTYTVTAIAVAGQQTNVGTVSGQNANNPPGTTVSDDNPGNYFGDTPAIHIVKFVNGQDADTPPGPQVAVGSTVTFTYVVTNTGNVPLANVVITDNKLGPITSFTGDTNGNGLIDLTETWTYTATATALAGQQTNVGTVTAQDANTGASVSDDNQANYFGGVPEIHIVKFVNGQDADLPTGPYVAVGSTVTFTYVVTNTGNVPLANVVVSDNKLGTITSFTGDTNGNGLLDLTETWTYTTTATALAGQQTNTGTTTALDTSTGTTVTDSNPANYFGDAPAINIVKFVNGQDADTPTGPQVSAGSTVTFTYVVTNTGNVPLANVVLTDDKLGTVAGPALGDTNGNGLLDLTELWIYRTTATALAGQQTNVGTVTANDANNPPDTAVTDTNPANYFGAVPAINIVKFVNGQDADTPTGPHVAVGSTVTFTYVVTNTGNVPLASVVVSDDELGPIITFTGDTNGNGLLDLTETWTYTATPTALVGQQTNIGTVTGQDTSNPPSTPVTDDNPANYFGDALAINIVKFVNGQDADTPTGPHVAAGSTVTFTYVVTNTGNVPLANAAVTDDKLGTIAGPASGDTNGNGLLDLTETWTYTTTATALAGQQTNVGTVTANDANNPPGTTVTDTNPANYFGDAPGVNIVKFVNGQDADTPTGPHVAAGSTVTFTYVVTNTGNVPLANAAVTDDKLGTIAGPTSGDTNGNGLLDLTETWTYTATATALAGQQTNVGTVTAQDPNTGTTVTDDNPGNYFGDAPAINIVKFVNGQDADTPPGPHVDAGSTVTFTYVVTNTGNVPLANVAVSDDKLGPITTFTGDTNNNGLLDLTETWTYTKTATAVGGQQTNVGTVTAQDPNNPPGTLVTDDNPANYFGDEFDFGDAPDSFHTLLASDGPRHRLGSTLLLGATVDADPDGQPSPDSLGDDTDVDGDDEDGVNFVTPLIPHLDAVVTVTSSGAGFVDAWLDFNGSGSFDSGEQIAASFPVIAGNNNILFNVPASAAAGTKFARFRLSSTGGLSPTGLAADGEVEDRTIRILACPNNSVQVVADPVNPGQKVLLVCGTNGNDVYVIEPRPSNLTQVRVKSTGLLIGIVNNSQFQSIAAFGKAGNDTIIVDARILKPAQLFGDAGDDQLFGAGGADRIFGGDGADRLFGGNNNDILTGNGGNDLVYGQNGNDTLKGNDGNDQMWGEAGSDRLFGGIGNDVLSGGDGNDRVFGGGDNDRVYGDGGNDIVLGENGNDLVYGGQGRDILLGGNGNDTLFGEQEEDILVAGPTSHDSNEAALQGILNEWASSHTYNARVNNIRTGGGLTGGFAFNAGTVVDDGVIDTLWGKEGQDWFRIGVGDLLKDKAANELVN